jgi:hypothetical protein
VSTSIANYFGKIQALEWVYLIISNNKLTVTVNFIFLTENENNGLNKLFSLTAVTKHSVLLLLPPPPPSPLLYLVG